MIGESKTKLTGMKNIVDYIYATFSNGPTRLNTNNCNNINFWCPTGMNPSFHNSSNSD